MEPPPVADLPSSLDSGSEAESETDLVAQLVDAARGDGPEDGEEVDLMLEWCAPAVITDLPPTEPNLPTDEGYHTCLCVCACVGVGDCVQVWAGFYSNYWPNQTRLR